MKHVFYNPISRTHKSEEELTALFSKDGSEVKIVNALSVEDYDAYIASTPAEDTIILSGGDGTLFHFVNTVNLEALKHDIYLHRAGNGNDFLNDIKHPEEDAVVLLNPYLKNLPTVTINGKDYKFVNGVGYGIDGMVCAEGERMRKSGKTEINYTSIAIKLVLTKYKRPNAIVKVDGVESKYKKVWLGSAMNGRYYGGGMMVAPEQDRLSDGLSCVVWHNHARLGALMLFTKVFTGEHVKDTKHVHIVKGNTVEVTFDRPTDLQLDGEVFLGVTSYVAHK